MKPSSRIFIAGHRGMVGSALHRALAARGYTNLVTRNRLDLTNQRAVNDFFANEPIDVVLLAAAKVGGIRANNVFRGDFIYRNLMIQTNVIHGAFSAGIQQLLFLGSSCAYPRNCPQPMKEEHLMGGYPEPTNAPYAVAKIAGIQMCESYNRQFGTRYRAVTPTNLFGPNDNFDLENSHVLPALIRKFHLFRLALKEDHEAIRRDEAVFGKIPEDLRKTLFSRSPAVTLWGTGIAKRQFLHVDDMADACIHLMALPDRQYRQICRVDDAFKDLGMRTVSHINIASGQDLTIARLADIVQGIVGYRGEVVWDASMPDGMRFKCSDSTRLAGTGWRHRIDLADGIRDTYRWYLKQA